MSSVVGAAVVSGAASGLGLAVVERLVGEGFHVAMLDRDEATLVDRSSHLGSGAHPFACDATDADAVADAVAAFTKATSSPRLLVCCHGILGPTRILRSDSAERFAQVISVNLVGTFNVLRAVAELMAENPPDERGERGVIVLTASIAAFEGQIGQSAYASSKAGVAGMVLPAARELADSGIRVLGVAPGMFATPMVSGLPEKAREALAAQVPFPPRFGAPDEFADLVAEIRRNQILNGCVLRADGALRLAPR